MKEYFSHDYNARNDTKLVKLFMKLGLEGIGAYWCIIEMLYEEGGYLLRNEYERIAFELRTDYNVIKKIVEELDLFVFDDEKFWSETALSRLNQRMEKSQKARESVEKRWKKYERNTNVKQSKNDSNTSKGKESKVKKSILFDEFWNLYNKKVGNKKACKKKWDKLTYDKQKTIIQTLPEWLTQFSEKQFQPHPETYLNNERWNDEIIKPKKQVNNNFSQGFI